MAKNKLAIWLRECSFSFHDLHQQINESVGKNSKHITIAE